MRKLNIRLEEFRSKILREGSIQGIEMSNPAIIAPISGSTTIGGISLPPTECFFLESITMSVVKGSAVLQTTNYNSPNNSSVGENSIRLALNNNAVTIPCNSVLLAGSTISSNVRNGDGSTSLMASCYYSGLRITADTNFNAKNVILWIGDSISRGSSMGAIAYSNKDIPATPPNAHFAFKVRDYLNQEFELDARLVIKAMGSYTSTAMDYHIQSGWCDIDQADVIFYQMGTNDATGTTTDAQFLQNMQNLIAWKKRKFPQSKLILLGSTPLNNSTNETRLTTLRQIEANLVDTINEIYYINLANSFNRNDTTKYTSSDGVHPNITTNAEIAEFLKVQISNLGIF